MGRRVELQRVCPGPDGGTLTSLWGGDQGQSPVSPPFPRMERRVVKKIVVALGRQERGICLMAVPNEVVVTVGKGMRPISPDAAEKLADDLVDMAELARAMGDGREQ